jgi:hypothetical protein
MWYFIPVARQSTIPSILLNASVAHSSFLSWQIFTIFSGTAVDLITQMFSFPLFKLSLNPQKYNVDLKLSLTDHYHNLLL